MQPENNSETKFTNSISNEIINSTIDLGIEYAEINLDEIFSDGILKEIPIVKTLYSIGKIGLSIRERFFVKKLLVFLKEFHSQNISEENMETLKKRFNSDIKYRDKVTEHIIVFTETFLHIEKSKIHAKLFKSYIEGNFEWSHFIHLSTCLNSLNPKAFPFLIQLSKYNFTIPEDISGEDMQRDFENEPLLSASGIAYDAGVWSSGYYVTELGKDLFNYGIK
jgi:hypothetical protein